MLLGNYPLRKEQSYGGAHMSRQQPPWHLRERLSCRYPAVKPRPRHLPGRPPTCPQHRCPSCRQGLTGLHVATSCQVALCVCRHYSTPARCQLSVGAQKTTISAALAKLRDQLHTFLNGRCHAYDGLSADDFGNGVHHFLLVEGI